MIINKVEEDKKIVTNLIMCFLVKTSEKLFTHK